MTARKAMTCRRGGATARAVDRLRNFLIGIALVLSLSIGGVAHAAEEVCMPSVEATASGHTDGDSDQTPHDGSGYAHHHGGCHGHHNLIPFDGDAAIIDVVPRTEGVDFEAALRRAAPPSSDLRPPIA